MYVHLSDAPKNGHRNGHSETLRSQGTEEFALVAAQVLHTKEPGRVLLRIDLFFEMTVVQCCD